MAHSSDLSRPQAQSVRDVLKQQDWGTLLASLACILALVGVAAAIDSPAERPFVLYDAAISYPHSGPSTFHYNVAWLVPLACLLVTLCIFQPWLSPGLLSALSGALHYFLDAVMTLGTTVVVTHVTKLWVGYLRPDFLARCGPVAPADGLAHLAWGLDASRDVPACQHPGVSAKDLSDGRMSFPSGHSSAVWSICLYAALYVVWAADQGGRGSLEASEKSVSPMPRSEGAQPSSSSRFARESPTRSRWRLSPLLRDVLVRAGAHIWALLLLLFAGAVSASRIVDFRHHASDVCGGAFLGSVLAGLFFWRAALRYHAVPGIRGQRFSRESSGFASLREGQQELGEAELSSELRGL